MEFSYNDNLRGQTMYSLFNYEQVKQRSFATGNPTSLSAGPIRHATNFYEAIIDMLNTVAVRKELNTEIITITESKHEHFNSRVW